MRRRRGSQWLLCWLSVLSAQCSTAVQKANGARSDYQSPMLPYSLSKPQTASRNVPSRSRFTPSCCLDRRFHLPRIDDKASPIKKVQIDSLGRPDKSAPTPILPLSPCSEPQFPKLGPLAPLIGQPDKIGPKLRRCPSVRNTPTGQHPGEPPSHAIRETPCRMNNLFCQTKDLSGKPPTLLLERPVGLLHIMVPAAVFQVQCAVTPLLTVILPRQPANLSRRVSNLTPSHHPSLLAQYLSIHGTNITGVHRVYS